MARTYNMTVAGIEAKVRRLTNDTNPLEARQRIKSAEMLGWITDAVSAMVGMLPGLFAVEGVHTCTAGTFQQVELERSVALLDVIGVPNADMNTLTEFFPAWRSEAAGSIENWMRNGDEQLSFYCTPPAVGGEELPVMYARTPDPFTDVVPVPEQYEPAIVDYVVAMINSKDDEHVNSGTARLAMSNFVARITGKSATPEA